MGLDAVIFDLGGTLIEYAGTYTTWPALEAPGVTAAYDILAAHAPSLPAYDLFETAVFQLLPQRWQAATCRERNLTVASLLAEAAAAHQVTLDETTLPAAARAYEQAIQAQAWLMPQAVETVTAVRQSGLKVGLISNTMFNGDAHRADLERFGLLPAFDAALFSADVNLWKPNPDPFLQMAQMLGVVPETAVYVGDDPASDVVGAKSAGMRAVYIKSTQRFAAPDGVQPDAQINQLPELIEILHNWRKT